MIKTKISWCDSSYNPITGCAHGCTYCYAHKLAFRFKGCEKSPDGTTEQKIIELNEPEYIVRKTGERNVAAFPYGFTPTFHKYRLDELKKKKYRKNIFVCSTADLFGRWIPDEWITQVFDSCIESPNHRYLFLTKNPSRYLELADKNLLPKLDNFWYGTTVPDNDTRYFYAKDYNTFISVEPIMEKFRTYSADIVLAGTKWIVVGAETGQRKGKVTPKADWIEYLEDVCMRYSVPIFEKESLENIMDKPLIQQFPWED